jgi:hypothetical protein
MCLWFVFLLITRVAAWLRLSHRGETWKTAEILILRHKLNILQRRCPHRPKLNWADRALLVTLLGVIPKARRHRMRLLVTPETILRWHRDLVRCRQAARSMRRRAGRPATGRNIQALVRRLARENVRAENLVHGSDQHGCSSGRPAVMITDHVPAVHVPPDPVASRGAAASPA